MTNPSETDDTARLEAALNRIAQASPAPASADRQTLAARLDALIGDLRAALGRDSAD